MFRAPQSRGPGTTLAEPVAADHKPDLGTSLYEISEYLESQQAYDLFDYLLRDLLVAQPKDPLQHLINCLDVQVPSGPLQVFVCGAPGVGRSKYCRDLASKFGLTYISAGELLRDKLGVKTEKLHLADDQDVSKVVIEAVKQAKAQMQGFVLDGFPRTRIQTTILQENAIVPSHVLMLKGSEENIFRKAALDDNVVDRQVLEAKINQHTCHCSAALEVYASKIKVIDAFAPAEFVASEMERIVRMLPRSKGPGSPPRVLILGPRGSGVREHASRLASRLGAVFVDGERLQSASSTKQSETQPSQSILTSIDLSKEKLASLAKEDALGEVGVRLRQPDCKSRGYVLCGFVNTPEIAKLLAEDLYLSPTRIVALQSSVEVCVARLRNLSVDKVTGQIWTCRPEDETLRKRLQKSQEDTPSAVAASYEAFNASLPGILQTLGSDGRCQEIQADGDAEDVFMDVVEFVERPLPLR